MLQYQHAGVEQLVGSADCKSAPVRACRFESYLQHQHNSTPVITGVILVPSPLSRQGISSLVILKSAWISNLSRLVGGRLL